MRIFVKEYPQQASEKEVRSRCGKIAGIIGIASNILLFAIKLAVGIISNSLAIIADSMNNLADSASSLVTAVAFKVSGKPADDEHPFGHARVEYVAGMIVSFLIVFVGFQLGVSSVKKIISPEETTFSLNSLIVISFSILIKLWQWLFYKKVGKTVNSSTIIATSADSRNDAVATLIILVGAVFMKLTGVNIDGWLGAAVAIFILISGVKLIIETANPLLGVAPDKELVKQVTEKILSYNGILGVHDLTVHNYGEGQRFASVHCEVSASEDIMKSHDIIDNIERDFVTEMGIQLVIHLDPIETDNEETNNLKVAITGELLNVYPQASIHDFRVVWGITHTNVLFDIAVPFTLKDSDANVKETAIKIVRTLSENYHPVIVVDRISC